MSPAAGTIEELSTELKGIRVWNHPLHSLANGAKISRTSAESADVEESCVSCRGQRGERCREVPRAKRIGRERVQPRHLAIKRSHQCRRCGLVARLPSTRVMPDNLPLDIGFHLHQRCIGPVCWWHDQLVAQPIWLKTTSQEELRNRLSCSY